ncbi:glycerate 3-kinase [Malassezia vespertilionis]|uniref:glycerate 3-kinase n=1 Tax=Malassezia vespertilionis TaxID=2020962 RepID=UPI0024B09D8C|nr:glycerate 3-kinase [Malassezia vespertilionis]WFD05132.1 glycerate 3-kinase [Malassezia vespertilionis]
MVGKEDVIYLYLPYAEMKTVGDANFSNALLQGRGQPGTHDIERGRRILSTLHENTFDVLSLPKYDKSARGGFGDRYADEVEIQRPLDIVLFEGWCLGFCALDAPALDGLWAAPYTDELAYFLHTREDFDAINDSLRRWESAWYPYIDAFIQYMPSAAPEITPWSLVYPWRLEAEHEMKKLNGGIGMSDAQIQSFVARFLPTYEIFAMDLRERNPWSGKCLCFELGPDRVAKAVYRV